MMIGSVGSSTFKFIIPLQAETTSWLARVDGNGGSVSAPDADAVNTFIYTIKKLGISDTAHRVNPFIGNNWQAAFTPIFRCTAGNGADYDTNSNGSIYASYTRSAGFTGDGSGFLDTGVDASALFSGTNTNNHMGVYTKTISATASTEIGTQDGLNAWNLNVNWSFGNGFMYYGFSTGSAPNVVVPSQGGMFIGCIDFTNSKAYQYLPQLGTSPTSIISTTDIFDQSPPATGYGVQIFAQGNGPSPSFQSTRTLGGYTFGFGVSKSYGQVTPADIVSYAVAWNTLMSAVGR